MERIKHMATRHFWSQESLRKGRFGLNVIDTITTKCGHRHEVLERHNEEYVVGTDATVLRKALDWLRWWSLRERLIVYLQD